MRIEQLQAFLAVADSGSFGIAAQQFGLTQSTISRQIQSLENNLGMPLFHRTAQAKLTIAGEKLLPHARRISREWQIATQDIADLKAGKQPELCVAAISLRLFSFSPSPPRTVLPRFTRRKVTGDSIRQ